MNIFHINKIKVLQDNWQNICLSRLSIHQGDAFIYILRTLDNRYYEPDWSDCSDPNDPEKCVVYTWWKKKCKGKVRLIKFSKTIRFCCIATWISSFELWKGGKRLMARTWRVDRDSFISTILNQICISCKKMNVHLASILVMRTLCALIPQRDISAHAKVGMRVMERPAMMSTSVQRGCTIVMITQHARIQMGPSSATVIRISVETAKNVLQRTVYRLYIIKFT